MSEYPALSPALSRSCGQALPAHAAVTSCAACVGHSALAAPPAWLITPRMQTVAGDGRLGHRVWRLGIRQGLGRVEPAELRSSRATVRGARAAPTGNAWSSTTSPLRGLVAIKWCRGGRARPDRLCRLGGGAKVRVQRRSNQWLYAFSIREGDANKKELPTEIRLAVKPDARRTVEHLSTELRVARFTYRVIRVYSKASSELF